jgi:hypothetical protein
VSGAALGALTSGLGCGGRPADPAPAGKSRSGAVAQPGTQSPGAARSRGAKTDDGETKSDGAAQTPSRGDGDRATDGNGASGAKGSAADPSTTTSDPISRPGPAADPVAAPVFRPADRRPVHDERRLAALGIRRFESTRLILWTDAPEEKVRDIPAAVDAAHDAWVAAFGALPADRAGRAWQATGYLIADIETFRRAGLIPVDLPKFVNGRHRDREFWMHDQAEDYYRRHLAIHEATHCYMTTLPGAEFPVWYLEGMAERFATHRRRPDGTWEFGVVPDDKKSFEGLGRIALVRREVAAGRGLGLQKVLDLTANDFLKNESYAWSWALCTFLDGHPAHRDRFRALGRPLDAGAFERRFLEAFESDGQAIVWEWASFATDLQEGYDQERAAVRFVPGTDLAPGTAREGIVVRADRGWQPSGIAVVAGREYAVTAEGRFTVADRPVPWECTADGVSFRYVGGRPIGQLLGQVWGLRDADGSGRLVAGPDVPTVPQPIPLGVQARFTAPQSGTLLLRLNDDWSELADDAGSVRATIRSVGPQAK